MWPVPSNRLSKSRLSPGSSLGASCIERRLGVVAAVPLLPLSADLAGCERLLLGDR